jgi:hypothetical protein
MKCYICNSPTRHYFSKNFDRFELDTVDYQRCTECGSVFAQTLLQLPERQWQSVCKQYHGSYRGTGENPDDPNWHRRLERQAEVLVELADRDLLSTDEPWLDHGCGEGEMVRMLKKRIAHIECYDRYWQKNGYLQDSELLPGGYSTVISTSTLEHLRSRSSMDAIAALVSMDGSLCLHTMVRGEIPCDPNWYYLLPVHTIFYTNRGMELLFEQWRFRSSLYVPDARLWVWFRTPLEQLSKVLPDLTSLPDWHVAEGFIAYWP